jgi:hypothetical protein
VADDAPVARVVVLGRSVRRVAFQPGATLGQVLAEAGIDTAGRDLHVNGRPAGTDTTLADGDLVTVIPRVRGGMHLCTIDPLETASEVASAG